MKNIFGFKPRSENPKRFYLWFAVVSIFFWAIMGLISFIPTSGILSFIIKLLVGLAPCSIFLFSILTWLEVKRKTFSTEKFQKIEDYSLMLFGLLTLFAEVVFQTSGGISFGLPMTIASLMVVGIIRNIPPKDENADSGFINRRFSSFQIIKILFFGVVACIIFANFISSTAAFVEKFVN